MSYTGGEPLLREDIGELLEFSSRKIGFYTGLACMHATDKRV